MWGGGQSGIKLQDIIQMASINPAKQIGIFDRKGSIAKGKEADLLIADNADLLGYTEKKVGI